MFKKKNNSTTETVDLEGISQEIYNRRWWILIALCTAELGVMLANSSLNMALPAMSRELNLTQASLTWIVNIYTLVFASFLFLAGALGDRYGRKMAMQTGLGIFTIGTLYAAFAASTATELIIARAIMGLGGALVFPTTLSIINNTFPTKKRAQAIAIWSAVAGVGMMFGSVVSGVILEFFSWHSLFLFSTIVAVVGFIVNHIYTPESRDEESLPIDWVGGGLTIVGLFSLVFGITEAPSSGLLDPLVAGSITLGVVTLTCFVLYELRTKHPMLDMKLFKNKAFSVSTLTLTLTFLALAGVFFSISQVEQLILGFSALQASLALIPVMLPMMFISPLIPKVVERIGARLTVSIGLLIASCGFLLMSTWTPDMTYIDLLLMGFLMMTGISAAMTPGTNILMASVPRNRSGMGSAMNDTTRELGGALGVAVLGAILAAVYEEKIASTASQFTGEIKTALESSLAVALRVGEEMGPAGESIVEAAKLAWMQGIEQSALIAAGILIFSAVVAFLFLPKKAEEDRLKAQQEAEAAKLAA